MLAARFFSAAWDHSLRQKRLGFRCLASPASAWAHSRGYGNINPLSIDYACRPRLRSRLTLGGLACPRNPWSFGGGVSHPSFATHACILTRVASTAGSLRCFSCHTTLPYPSAHLDPKGARGHSTGVPRPKPRETANCHPPLPQRAGYRRECHSFG